MSISANVGVHGSSVVEVQAWISNDAWLPSQHSVAARSATRWSFAARSSRSRNPVSCQIVSHLGADDGMSFCQNPGAAAPFGNRWRFSGRSARCGSIDGAIRAKYADEVALGEGGLVDAVTRREQHLVEVRELELLAGDAPACPRPSSRRSASSSASDTIHAGSSALVAFVGFVAVFDFDVTSPSGAPPDRGQGMPRRPRDPPSPGRPHARGPPRADRDPARGP